MPVNTLSTPNAIEIASKKPVSVPVTAVDSLAAAIANSRKAAAPMTNPARTATSARSRLAPSASMIPATRHYR